LDNIEDAVYKVYETIIKDNDIIVVVDCDLDGYTSASIFINYLDNYFPDYCEHKIRWLHHEGKQHGLSDVIDQILEMDKTEEYLVVCPDSASNDLEEHKIIYSDGGMVITLDHHESGIKIPESIIVNPQTDNYPNKSITGAGVTWQFCRAFDDIYNKSNPKANNYLDLCALGNCGDMADYRELEIRALVNLGLSDVDKLRNAFLIMLANKNEYIMAKRNGLNYLSSSFSITPFINAVCRSGTMEEKELVFQAFLELPFGYVESSKRGEKGLCVPVWVEGVTLVERIKRRQTQFQDAAMEILEEKIQDENLLDNSVLVFTCEKNSIPSSIKGLAANKLQAKYQRPVLVLSEDDSGNYSGSGRNYSMSEIQDFKDVCRDTELTEYAEGQLVAHIYLFRLSAGF
jgi:single-stranded-DNA-specific exonuclease